MNITFFIGNGFDLNLDLNTSYKHFYKFFKNEAPDNMIAQSINSDYEIWSDLELGLGEFTKTLTVKQKEQFLDSKDEAEELLIKYMEKQNSRFHIVDEKALIKQIQNNIVNISREFTPKEQRHFQAVMNYSDKINYQFIDFNYTDILDKIVVVIRKNLNPFSKRIIGSQAFSDSIANPIHIHGTTKQNMILGVNDFSQISNPDFQNDSELLDYIVKPRLNENIGYYHSNDVQNVIKESKYICVFGMSIGDTDNCWWQSVVRWLLGSTDRRLVLYTRDDTVVAGSAAAQIRFARKKKEIMLHRNIKLNPAERQKIINQTIIVNNSDIFNLKGIKIDKEDEDGQVENGD